MQLLVCFCFCYTRVPEVGRNSQINKLPIFHVSLFIFKNLKNIVLNSVNERKLLTFHVTVFLYQVLE